MSSFDTQVHTDEQIPCCPFCEQVLDGETVNGLHASCSEQLAFELDLMEEHCNVTNLRILPFEVSL